MSKIYVLTKPDGTPIKRGNSRKCAWTSPRWLVYHFGRSTYFNDCKVQTIDLSNGSISSCSLQSFLLSLKNPEGQRVEIQKSLGFNVDLAGLESLIKSKSLSESANEAAISFLSSIGIKC